MPSRMSLTDMGAWKLISLPPSAPSTGWVWDPDTTLEGPTADLGCDERIRIWMILVSNSPIVHLRKPEIVLQIADVYHFDE